ncbi:hypothetical protein BDV26DRAFT_293925 [Aspergillus bertholletiae]|uniref:Uncharacterized protein n=1 Tax=Aspergillus bertholletiae TaxID=1226010 RepID=A0A5N7B685_9EURO|nr:hypothetical protein BDV26DRAFT_293925 [Aspergillus bertholletiae]
MIFLRCLAPFAVIALAYALPYGASSDSVQNWVRAPSQSDNDLSGFAPENKNPGNDQIQSIGDLKISADEAWAGIVTKNRAD